MGLLAVSWEREGRHWCQETVTWGRGVRAAGQQGDDTTTDKSSPTTKVVGGHLHWWGGVAQGSALEEKPL